MNQNYNVVPKIISCKDLDYLSDMFNWNYLAYKKINEFSNSVNDQEIKDIFNSSSNLFYESMVKVLSNLNNGGNNEQ